MTRDRGNRPGGRDESDEQLMLSAGQGDRDAFGELVRRYSSRMVNVAYQVVGDRELAEDIAQETFLRAYKSAARYRQISKFSTWLYTIALNLCRNELRRRKFKTYSLEGMAERDEDSKVRTDIPDEKTQPDLDMERKEAGSLVRQAVEQLPEKFKTPLVLRDIQELSYEEISGILNLPEGTVKSRINRGRQRIKEILKPYYGSGDSGGEG